MFVRALVAAGLGILLGTMTLIASGSTVRADHDDGNMPLQVNYFAVDEGQVRICDQSLMVSSTAVTRAIDVWNANAQKSVMAQSCSNPAIYLRDANDGDCPVSGNPVACGELPTSDSPQSRLARFEDDLTYATGSFTASYYPNTTHTGNPVLVRTENEIDFDWGFGSPGPGVPSDNFSVRWEGTFNFGLSGIYNFTTLTDDGVRVWVDPAQNPTPIIDGWSGGLNQRTGQKSITPGNHVVRVDYYEGPGAAIAKMEFSNDYRTSWSVAHEIGHTLGFDHTGEGCFGIDTIMGSAGCEGVLPTSTQAEIENWDQGYWPDAVGYALLPTTQTGCFYYNWFNGNVHNERFFDTWHFDGGATFVRSDAKNSGSIGSGSPHCGQMPGTRSYHTYSVSNAHFSYFGANIVRSHSHTGGGFSSYSNVYDAYTPPNVPSALSGSFNEAGNPNRVASCWSVTPGATSYRLFFLRAGAGTSYFVTVNPNTSCWGSVLRAETLTPEVYHIAVSACVAGTVCSPYRDMSGSLWWWIPCSTGTGCPASGSPQPGGHNH